MPSICMLAFSGGVIGKTQSYVLTVTSFIYIQIPALEKSRLKEMEVIHSFKYIIKTQIPSSHLASLPQESHPTSNSKTKPVSSCLLSQAHYNKHSLTTFVIQRLKI